MTAVASSAALRPSAVGARRSPPVGALADGLPTRVVLAALLPVVTVAPALGSTGTALRLLWAVAVAVVVLRMPARLRESQAVLLLSLVLVLVAHAVGSPSAGYGLTRLVNWLMFMSVVFLTWTGSRAALLARSLVATCWIQLIGVALQASGRMGGTWGGLLTSGSTSDPAVRNWLTRYTGFLGNPNDLGLLLGLGALLCMLTVAMGMTAHRFWTLLCAGAFLFGVFLTGSRGAILGLVVGLAVASLFVSRRQRLALGALSAVAAAYFASRAGPFRLVLDSIWAIFSGRDNSAGLRSGLWADQLRTNDSWWFGNGFGGHLGGGAQAGGGIGLDVGVQRSATVDNSWLKLLLEGGVLGVALLAVVLASLLAPLVTRRVRISSGARSEGAASAAVVITCAVVILWRSLSADILDINPWNAILWLTMGMAASLANLAPDEPRARRRRGGLR